MAMPVNIITGTIVVIAFNQASLQM